MNITINDIEKSQKELLFSLSPEDMKPYVDEAAERLGKDLKVKGFRDGKVPTSVVVQAFGKEALWNEASADAIEESYAKAITEHDIQPIGRPRVDITKLVADNDFEFKVTIPCDPPVELPDYKSIAAKVVSDEAKNDTAIDEHEVEETLSLIQNSRMTKGEDGAEVKPELNDEFAKSLGGFKDLEELKTSIREGIAKEKEQAKAETTRLKIVEGIRKKAKMEISDLLIANELDKMQDEMVSRISSMGTSVEEYLSQIGKTMDEVREGWKEKALERVQTALILRRIADAEGIEPDEKQVEADANAYLRQFGEPEEANKAVSPELLRTYIRGMLRNEKVFAFLEGKDTEVSSDETSN
jgi:trigger factor